MSKNNQKISYSSMQGELFSFSPVQGKQIVVDFDSPEVSSLGGLLLMRESEREVGILSSLSSCLRDKRNPLLIHHTYNEMIIQRVFQIASGYEDCDDCDRLRDDDVLKVCAGRLPSGPALASQPTASRLENGRSVTELYDMALAFVDNFIASYADEPEVIIIDCDDSNANTYGNQQLTLFNQYYGEYCYMPLLIFEGISGKMILPILRPGRGNKSINIFGLLKRLIARLSLVWKHTRFVIRGDSHFCSHELMDEQTELYQQKLNDTAGNTVELLEWAKTETRVDFITGLSGNSVLLKMVEPWARRMREEFKRTNLPAKEFHRILYKAGSWQHKQQVVVKLEIGANGHKELNIRFVVHSFNANVSARQIYNGIYCKRGEMELYIKNLKRYLFADRMSCSSFGANQFRLFLCAAAYTLLLALKQNVFKGTEVEHYTMETFRERILLSAVYIKESKYKIVIEFSRKHFLKEPMEQAMLRFDLLRRSA